MVEENYTCGLCGKSTDSIYFYGDKQICENCHRPILQKERQRKEQAMDSETANVSDRGSREEGFSERS